MSVFLEIIIGTYVHMWNIKLYMIGVGPLIYCLKILYYRSFQLDFGNYSTGYTFSIKNLAD